MKALKLKSQIWLRKRYVVKKIDSSKLGLWFEEANSLKDQITHDSTFQLVGSKVGLELGSDGEWKILLEVLGSPQGAFVTLDDEGPLERLCFEVPESSFEIDFESLKKMMFDIKAAIPRKTTPRVHFVVDGAKLELHFFVQKDYIQP